MQAMVLFKNQNFHEVNMTIAEFIGGCILDTAVRDKTADNINLLAEFIAKTFSKAGTSYEKEKKLYRRWLELQDYDMSEANCISMICSKDILIKAALEVLEDAGYSSRKNAAAN